MGISTGYTSLDQILGDGLQPGFLYMICSRAGHENGALAVNLFNNICIKGQDVAAYFSLVASKEDLITRLLTLNAQVSIYSLKCETLEEEDWERIGEATEKIAKSNAIVDDTRDISVEKIRSECIRRREHNYLPKVVIVNPLESVKIEAKPCESRQDELTSVLKKLKSLAEEFGIAIVVMSLLSCEEESKRYNRPTISEITCCRDADKIADVVMFLYRDVYSDSDKKGLTEVIVANNQHGDGGIVEFSFASQDGTLQEIVCKEDVNENV